MIYIFFNKRQKSLVKDITKRLVKKDVKFKQIKDKHIYKKLSHILKIGTPIVYNTFDKQYKSYLDFLEVNLII